MTSSAAFKPHLQWCVAWGETRIPPHTQFIHIHEERMTLQPYMGSMNVECSRTLLSIHVSDHYVLHLKQTQNGTLKLLSKGSWEHLNNYLNNWGFRFSLFFLYLAWYNFSVHSYRMNSFLGRQCLNFTKFCFSLCPFFYFRVLSVF